ncbi:MAG: sigma-70 family RNA polymerase sigma factor [Planctomycetia bacterium]|nr:sigma-70 family RNA polymerase sigma factor [Planctomycetia bacterium]
MTHTPSDKELAQSAQSGDDESFDLLARKYQTLLMRYFLLRHAHEDALELIQETFLHAWKSLRTYNPQWQFSTWLFAIASQQSALFFRKRKRNPLGEASQVEWSEELNSPGRARSAEDQMIEREERSSLWRIVVQKLPREQSDALWLFYAEEKSLAEIAQVFGKTTNGVKMLLFRARKNLRRILNQKGE